MSLTLAEIRLACLVEANKFPTADGSRDPQVVVDKAEKFVQYVTKDSIITKDGTAKRPPGRPRKEK